MPSGVRDIQLLELKDTISQLNNTISTQNELIRSLQKMLQEHDAKDSEKDQLIANLQAQLDYLKTRLFGSTSEIRHEQLPGQLDLFHLQTEDEPEPVPLEVEYIEVKAHKKARKSKAAYDEVFADLPTENVYVDTLTEEQKTCDVCGTMMIPIILYNYTPTRAGSHAAAFLAGADPGYYLMVDGYKGYNKVPEAQRCCCWAHIRRYWLRAIPKGHEKDYTHPAVQGFLYCNKLFEL